MITSDSARRELLKAARATFAELYNPMRDSEDEAQRDAFIKRLRAAIAAVEKERLGTQ